MLYCVELLDERNVVESVCPERCEHKANEVQENHQPRELAKLSQEGGVRNVNSLSKRVLSDVDSHRIVPEELLWIRIVPIHYF